MAKYVIIGNSAAGIGCVEGIRSVDREGDILLIAAEPHHTYGRPLISYLLEGKTDETRMKYRPDSFYADNGVETRLGVRAVRLDAAGKTVELEGGAKVPYTQLLVATGSVPFVPPMDGLETVEKRFSFMTLDDAKALEAALTPESRVLIVGAGLIGLKCAEGIAARVREITVVDLADRVLPSILDETGSSIVQAHLEKQGLRFRLGDTVASFDGGRATLKSGAVLDFDVLVLAVGVRPETSLVAEAGGAVRRGIVTEDTGRTTLPSVYAAGDCAESYDISAGVHRVLALLPNAYMQGYCAGVNMAGGASHFDQAIPMNAIGFMGLHILTAGTYEGETYTAHENGNYKVLFYKDDLLKGYILIGDVARAGIYTALIRNRTPLSSIDFERICEKPQLMAFTAQTRRALLSKQQ